MKEYLLSKEEVLKNTESSLQGLTEKEALKRGLDMQQMSLSELDEIWEKVKKSE